MSHPFFKIDPKILSAADAALSATTEPFFAIDAVTEYNQQKLLKAFIDNGVSESHFTETTGYGYGDRGRDTLDKVCAAAFGAEDALMRHSFASGTHTLGVALFGVLRPGDTLLSVTGAPYDTIRPVIGITPGGSGSLADFGIRYAEVALDANGAPDLPAIRAALAQKPRMVYIQRSRGYTLRPSLSVEKIAEITALVKGCCDAVVMVDNCYGEFVQKQEPPQLGVDLIAGSLIKNAGGAIAKSGGYIAGRTDLIEQCAQRLTVPGIGREVGASLGHNRELFLGLFNAPHVTGEALKTAVFASALFESFGFAVTPRGDEARADIIQSVTLGNPEALIAFCRGMQSGAPVDAFVVPEPWDMPGYDSKVIMAAGAFTMGSSIELSADAPLREPYAAWLQGGINFHSAKAGVMLAAQSMLEKGFIS